MTSFNWCHGPECHEKKTSDRVRGTKGSKVLRTRKVTIYPDRSWYDGNCSSNFFCSQGCERDFWRKYGSQIRMIAPRQEPLETPIEVEKIKHPETVHEQYGWTTRAWTETRISKVEDVDI